MINISYLRTIFKMSKQFIPRLKDPSTIRTCPIIYRRQINITSCDVTEMLKQLPSKYLRHRVS